MEADDLRYKNGDVFKADAANCIGGVVVRKESGGIYVALKEYVVLEGYEPDKEGR